MITCVYGCLPGNYNWDIIFSGWVLGDGNDPELELKRVGEALDGTYRLNPTNPSVQHVSGMPDTTWPKRREEIITGWKCIMIKDALRSGVSRWIDNAVKYLNTKDISNEYKDQFPEMYNYLTDRNSIPYEKMHRIHYEIVETITKCENSKEVQDKRERFKNEQKKRAKLLIEYYKKKDYYCNKFFLEIEKNNMKSRELYEEYNSLKIFKCDYNKNNKLYDILYNSTDIFLIGNAIRIRNMRGSSELRFLEYLTDEKVTYITNLIKNATPMVCIEDKIKIEFEEL